MWMRDGTKLSGKYGTWRGREYELRSTSPIRGLIYLVQEGGETPGPEWTNHEQPNDFPRPSIAYTLGVPPDEVTNIHAVQAAGELGPGREVEIVGEDSDGNLAVVADRGFWAEEKWDLVEDQGFHTFHNEPVERSGVFGWLPAEAVNDIASEIYWRKDASSTSILMRGNRQDAAKGCEFR